MIHLIILSILCYQIALTHKNSNYSRASDILYMWSPTRQRILWCIYFVAAIKSRWDRAVTLHAQFAWPIEEPFIAI
jgi:hypothetical protein